MAKVIFFNVPGYGHINPTLPVVEELVHRGEEVIYYGTERFREKIERTGSIFRHYPRMDDANLRPPANPVEFAQLLLRYTAVSLNELLEDTRRRQVDYIMHDSTCLWGWAVARLLRIPGVCSTATFALNSTLVKEMNKWLGIPGGQLVRTILGNTRSALNVWRNVRQLRKAYHLPLFITRIQDVFVNRSELNLVYVSKELQPLADQFDESYRFVGSMVSPHRDIDFPFLEHVDRRKVIYISLGTVRNNHLGFCRACLSAFRGLDELVVMSVGNAIDIKELGPIPSNFMVYKFVPSQIESLKQARLFVTHGGVSGMSEGLFFGVPLLIFPQTVEQSFNARQVVNTGAGKILKESDLTGDRLRNLGRSILEDNSYYEAARRAGAALKSAGGYKRAVQEIDEFKRTFCR